jgi:hypothetical protein
LNSKEFQILKEKTKVPVVKNIPNKKDSKNALTFEEKETLKLLEKLEKQTLKKKPKQLESIPNTQRETQRELQSDYKSHKRLIDNMKETSRNKISSSNSKKDTNTKQITLNKFDKEKLDDTEFRKTIKKEKIEIDCDTTSTPTTSKDELISNVDDEKLDKEYEKNMSIEKVKFFKFKVRPLYEFLHSIHLVRFIEQFFEDGFEDLLCILGKFLKNFNF